MKSLHLEKHFARVSLSVFVKIVITLMWCIKLDEMYEVLAFDALNATMLSMHKCTHLLFHSSIRAYYYYYFADVGSP